MAAQAGGTSGRRALAALVAVVWAAAALADGGAEQAPLTDGQLEDLLEGPARQDREASRRYGEADLAPYFGSGALAEAKALFDRGFHGRARAMLR